MSRTILYFGISMAVLLAVLKWIEYQFYARNMSLELYLSLIGVFCTGLGAWIGWNLTRPKPKVEDEIAAAITSGIPSEGFDPENKFGLSPREYEVLRLIAQGHSYQEIADQLCVSLSTIKTHASNLFSKMDVQRRTQAVMMAQKTGLLPPTKA